MSTLNLKTIHYERLPETAYNAALDGIQKCGFCADAILPDYSISSRIKDQAVTFKINALAFAHPIRHIPDYAGITLFNAANGQSDEELVPMLAESTAPFHLIHRDEQFSFLASAVQNSNQLKPIPIESHIAYEQIGNMLSRYAADLKPQRIADVKQGRDTFSHPIFRDLAPLQLPLWVAEATRPLLVEYFGHAVERLRSDLQRFPKESTSSEMNEVTDLAIQILGATILADTGALGEDIRLAGSLVSLSNLIRVARQKFPRYFALDTFEKYTESAEKAYQLLRRIRYSGFMPDMLRELYIKAYSKEEQKKSGSYDTPLYLTRQIWRNIPVEYLSPDQRVVADITCGWGSFLIAGHERLSLLSDMKDISLRNYLFGNDIHFFTAKLAGLGLLLSTLEDSWNIANKDAHKQDWSNIPQPNIIVGNPPFGGSRKEHLTDKQERYQEANAFLSKAIGLLAPKGYLAMVLPRSFTSGEASPLYRKQLLETCDVLELWQIPPQVFPGVKPRAMVVFAQKKLGISHYPVRVRTIQPSTFKVFQKEGTFTASGLVTDQSAWESILHKSEGSKNTHIIDYRLILSEASWHTIQSNCGFLKLQERAIAFKGAIIGNSGKVVGKKAANRNLTEYNNPKHVSFLRRAKGILEHPFLINYKHKNCISIAYPNDLQWPRLDKQPIFEDTKVLVTSVSDPSWGKRAKVAIERKGYYASDNFWIVVPTEDAKKLYNITYEVLAAVISWDVSNAWIIEHITTTSIPEYAINTIPFPKNLSESDCQALTEAVLQVEKAASEGKDIPEALQLEIDDILKTAYALDDVTFKRLREVANWSSHNTQSSSDRETYQEDRDNWLVSGIVESIDTEQNTITLWLEGFDELQTVQIAPSMPGWMLRPNTAFRTEIPDGYFEHGSMGQSMVDWSTFRPQPYTYLSKEELFAKFTALLQ